MLKNIQRVLFVKKTSRLAYERMRASCNNDNLLAQEVSKLVSFPLFHSHTVIASRAGIRLFWITTKALES